MPPYDPDTGTGVGYLRPPPRRGSGRPGTNAPIFGEINSIIDGVRETGTNIRGTIDELTGRNPGNGIQPGTPVVGPLPPGGRQGNTILGIPEMYVYLGIGALALLFLIRRRA